MRPFYKVEIIDPRQCGLHIDSPAAAMLILFYKTTEIKFFYFPRKYTK